MIDSVLPEALADLFVRSGCLLLLAWAAATAIGRAGAPAASRHLVWLLCLAALLLLPLLAALLPALRLPILPAETLSPSAPMPAPSPAVVVPAAEPIDHGLPLAWMVYGFVAAAIAARLLLGRLLLAAHWRRADAHPGLDSPLDQLRSQLGIARRVHLRLSRDPAMPITWGLADPRILLPADAASWPEEKRRLVLLHELAHISRFDSPVRLAAGLACALYWFQPIVWLAVRRLRIEQEHAADDLVLAAGAGPRDYAFSLLDVAGGRVPRMMGGLHAAMAGPSELERRLRAIVAPGGRGRPGRLFVAVTIVAASASAMLAATAIPVAASPAVAAAAAEAAVQPAPAVAPVPAAQPATQPNLLQPVLPAQPAAQAVPAEDAFPLTPRTAVLATPVEPARPVAPVAPMLPAAIATFSSEPDRAEAVEDYRSARAVYRRQRQEYHDQLSEYHRQVEEQHRQVAELRREGNLGNSGNDGNAGNVGNEGNEGGPGSLPVLPTAPTAPTPPTPPSPIYRHIASVASVETMASAQGP